MKYIDYIISNGEVMKVKHRRLQGMGEVLEIDGKIIPMSKCIQIPDPVHMMEHALKMWSATPLPDIKWKGNLF